MSRLLPVRLGLDGLAAGLLFVGLAYHWLDNLSHEVVGTAFFALVVLHAVFNRRWYGALLRVWPTGRALVSTVLNLTLLGAALVLLATSLAISRDLFAALGLDGGFAARRLHALAAYWALVIVALHLGLHWPMIMGVARRLFGLANGNLARKLASRIAAAGLAACGIVASADLGLGGKLASELSMEWWDFEASTLGFFTRLVAVVGLYAAPAHYGVLLAGRLRSAEEPGPLVERR